MDAKTEIDALLKAGTIDDAKAKALRAAARKALLDSFKPSYDALITWFEQDMKNTDAQARGAGALPQGREFYNERLASSTTTRMTADEVHDLGRAHPGGNGNDQDSSRLQGHAPGILHVHA